MQLNKHAHACTHIRVRRYTRIYESVLTMHITQRCMTWKCNEYMEHHTTTRTHTQTQCTYARDDGWSEIKQMQWNKRTHTTTHKRVRICTTSYEVHSLRNYHNDIWSESTMRIWNNGITNPINIMVHDTNSPNPDQSVTVCPLQYKQTHTNRKQTK